MSNVETCDVHQVSSFSCHCQHFRRGAEDGVPCCWRAAGWLKFVVGKVMILILIGMVFEDSKRWIKGDGFLNKKKCAKKGSDAIGLQGPCLLRGLDKKQRRNHYIILCRFMTYHLDCRIFDIQNIFLIYHCSKRCHTGIKPKIGQVEPLMSFDWRALAPACTQSIGRRIYPQPETSLTHIHIVLHGTIQNSSLNVWIEFSKKRISYIPRMVPNVILIDMVEGAIRSIITSRVLEEIHQQAEGQQVNLTWLYNTLYISLPFEVMITQCEVQEQQDQRILTCLCCVGIVCVWHTCRAPFLHAISHLGKRPQTPVLQRRRGSERNPVWKWWSGFRVWQLADTLTVYLIVDSLFSLPPRNLDSISYWASALQMGWCHHLV